MPSRRRVLGLLMAGTTAVSGCALPPAPQSNETDGTTTAPGSPATLPADETADMESNQTEKDAMPDVACEQPWAGTAVYNFAGATGLGRSLPWNDRLYVGSDSGEFALTHELDPDWNQPSVNGAVYDVTDDVVIASSGDRVAAIDRKRGEVLWTFEPPGEYARIARGPAVHGGTVYVAASQVPTASTDPETEYGRLYGLRVATGSESFVTDLAPTDRELVEPDHLISDAAGVFVTLSEGGLLGVTHDGTITWRRAGDDWYYRPDRVGNLVLQPRSRSVVAVDTETGETQWESDAIEMHVTASAGVVYGAAGGGPDNDGTLAALDHETDQRRWEVPIRGCGHRPVVGAGKLAVHVDCRPGAGHISLIDTATGCRYGEHGQSADVTPALAIASGRLYASIGENRGTLVAFELPE